jgi:uncharacterized membrane-anchored protein YjiN (DUF445 family)
VSGTVLSSLLPWLAPPVVGAVIGWVTNDIAIRMLFRPLKEIRVFGLRVPFTPGIFPKERYRLARSIGRMVSRELITEDALRAQVRSPATQEQLSRAVSSVTGRALGVPLGRVAEQGLSFLSGSLAETAGGLLQSLFNSRAMISAVRDIVAGLVAGLAGQQPSAILDKLGVRKLLTERFLPSLAQPGRRREIAQTVAVFVADRAGSLLSDDVIQGLAAAARPHLPVLAARLSRWLQEEDVRSTLSERGRDLLPRILEKLNIVQRFLLSAGQFDRRLTEKMPEIVDDTVATLQEMVRDPVQQERVLLLAAGFLADLRDELRKDEAHAAGGPRERLQAGIARATESALGSLEEPAARAGFSDALLGGLGKETRTLGALLRDSFGLTEGDLVDLICTRVLEFLTGGTAALEAGKALAGAAERFLQDNAARTVAEVLHVDVERKARLDAWCTARLSDIVDERLPEILRGIDLEGLVVRKIDGLDVRDVERLLVQVIASHLKWINVFGAILGFLIGVLQLVLKVVGLS